MKIKLKTARKIERIFSNMFAFVVMALFTALALLPATLVIFTNVSPWWLFALPASVFCAIAVLGVIGRKIDKTNKHYTT